MRSQTKFVLALVLACALITGCGTHRLSPPTTAAEAQRSRAQIAEAMFQERCKSAGEKIHKTVQNVEGSSLRVLDLQTNEVIAERIGYMMDWAQGSQAGGRSPWLFAADYACPSFQ